MKKVLYISLSVFLIFITKQSIAIDKGKWSFVKDEDWCYIVSSPTESDLPETKKEFNTYHTFVVQVSKRDKLKKYLKSKGIETSIHYPIPIHLQPALKKLKYRYSNLNKTEKQSKKIITLPINQFLKKSEIQTICHEVNNFYENF